MLTGRLFFCGAGGNARAEEKPSATAGPYSRPWDIERCNDMSPPEGRHLLHTKSLCCKFQTPICMLAPATVLGDELDRLVLGNRLASQCSPALAKFGWMTGCMVGGWRLMGLGGTRGTSTRIVPHRSFQHAPSTVALRDEWRLPYLFGSI